MTTGRAFHGIMATERAYHGIMTTVTRSSAIFPARKALVALVLLGFLPLASLAPAVWSAPDSTRPAMPIGGDNAPATEFASQVAKPTTRLTADQAAERARAQTGGHVVSIRQQPDGYWVRMLSARGQVRDIWIPSTNR